MSDTQTVIYLGILFFYCCFYFVAMRNRKEDKIHNILSVVIFILGAASIVFPLFFDKLWKFVTLVSFSLIVATIFVEPSDTSASGGSSVGGPI